MSSLWSTLMKNMTHVRIFLTLYFSDDKKTMIINAITAWYLLNNDKIVVEDIIWHTIQTRLSLDEATEASSRLSSMKPWSTIG